MLQKAACGIRVQVRRQSALTYNRLASACQIYFARRSDAKDGRHRPRRTGSHPLEVVARSVQKRLALAVVLGIFALLSWLQSGCLRASTQGESDTFMTAYSDSGCSVLRFDHRGALILAQFSILRSRATLVIGAGTSSRRLFLIPYGLTLFQVCLRPSPKLANLQSAACLLFCGTAVFPPIRNRLCFVEEPRLLATTFEERAPCGRSPECRLDGGPRRGRRIALHNGRSAVYPTSCSIAVTLARCGSIFVGVPVALLSTSALVLLWIRRRSMLDLADGRNVHLPDGDATSYYPDPSRFSAAGTPRGSSASSAAVWS